MKTILKTVITILFTTQLLAQDYAVVDYTEIDTETRNFSSVSKTGLTSVSSLTLEIYETSNFQYRKFLRNAKNSGQRYQIGTETYIKKELIKIFRKGARRNENVLDFEKYLTEINPEFLNNVSERETIDVFNKFREGTFHAYVDSLPSVF